MFKDNLVSLRKMHGFSQDELAETASQEGLMVSPPNGVKPVTRIFMSVGFLFCNYFIHIINPTDRVCKPP